MPGTRPGMTRLAKVPDFIDCILSQTLRMRLSVFRVLNFNGQPRHDARSLKL